MAEQFGTGMTYRKGISVFAPSILILNVNVIDREIDRFNLLIFKSVTFTDMGNIYEHIDK